MTLFPKTKSLTKFSIAFAIILLGQSLYGQIIEKIMGKSALINMQGKTLAPGTQWITVDQTGKKIGLVKIKQIRASQAVAEILPLGHVIVGHKLIPKPPNMSSFEETNLEVETSDPDTDSEVKPIGGIRSTSKGKDIGGIIIGNSQDTMSFVAGDSNTPPIYTENVTLTGSSYKLKGYFDNQYNNNLILRYSGGLDGFNGSYNATNSIINKSGTTSTVSLSSLALEIQALWAFIKVPKFDFWLGAGYSFQYTMSSSTNMNSLSMTSSYSNVLLIGAGVDISITNQYTLPIFYNTSTYLTGKGITQSNTTLGVGLGWKL
jgi:hypothetical protein